MKTLAQVSQSLRQVAANSANGTAGDKYRAGWANDLADALDNHISQPQPVAQGEAVAWTDNDVETLRNLRDAVGKYANLKKLWVPTIDKILSRARHVDNPTFMPYATPTLPTGHRVVPVEPTEELSMTVPINAEVWRVRGSFTELFDDLEEAHKYASTIGAKVEPFYQQAVPSHEIEQLQDFHRSATKWMETAYRDSDYSLSPPPSYLTITIVDSSVGADDANRIYGDRYGVDWVYRNDDAAHDAGGV